MANALPNELQQVICQLLLDDPSYNVKIMQQLIRINKLWAHFVCNDLYRHYRITKYIPFIGFYNSVVAKQTILPYGDFIRSLDLTSINKYGVDSRAHQLIQQCPNLESVTLGHPTSLKPTTIQGLARHCQSLRTLSIGGLESFPFMLECDFSSLVGLITIKFTTTPLLDTSFLTLPPTLHELHLVRMETLDTKTMATFFQQPRTCLTRLAIHRCPRLVQDLAWLPLHQLKWLSLSGPDIRDEHVLALLTHQGTLDTLVLENTQITSKTLDSINGAAGRRLGIKHLHLNKNMNI